MYETYERFWRQNVYFCLFDCSTIYCATIRVLSQCTLDVFQEVYYAQNIGLSQVRHVYLSDYRFDMYICRTPDSITVVCLVQHIYLLDYLILLGRFFPDLTYISVRLLLKIFLLQSLLMEISEDTAGRPM